MGHPNLRALDLPRSRLSSEMRRDLPDVGDAGGRDRVTLRLQATRDIHRRAAIAPGGAGVEEVHGAAFGAEHEVVVVDEFGGGETVVQFYEIQIARVDAGVLIRHACGEAGNRIDVREYVAGVLPWVGRED